MIRTLFNHRVFSILSSLLYIILYFFFSVLLQEHFPTHSSLTFHLPPHHVANEEDVNCLQKAINHGSNDSSINRRAAYLLVSAEQR